MSTLVDPFEAASRAAPAPSPAASPSPPAKRDGELTQAAPVSRTPAAPARSPDETWSPIRYWCSED